jgi:stage III sporulation protein SpoIIIAA
MMVNEENDDGRKSCDVAGDAEECHACTGRARRMMVRRREEQADVLVQAVQNHNPDVIIVDEIGTSKEVAAARTICERGVLLIGTAHGISLSSLLRNPELRPLVGGMQAVTLGDAEAKASNNGQKVGGETS